MLTRGTVDEQKFALRVLVSGQFSPKLVAPSYRRGNAP